ncbi:GNAT family N-acetyltransferase [Vibrio ostreicida]|uniref:GNAT family N-acetyltransferase n=1 Tax=Vibrio ostreicida TaxID=526588 RepID=A0ABT8BZA2_9VIBR|nr:GNAT family N-acetyltransferase [Vibrio ostreicida]MDN3611408.1 GNAT family N-acetyltransferase [Vibrio ostreicida]NPD09334.1 GNAT family N-acetyltransferase [Vibrio ostreicida]
MIEFSYAVPEQSQLLGDIAIESKGYWGYSREQLEIWRKDLRIEEGYITDNLVKVVLLDSKIVGFFAIKSTNSDELDHLWLLPEVAGKGIGNLVFEEILRECKRLNIREFSIISDPDAEGFYLYKGAVRIGEVKSIPQKRMLPKLKYQLAEFN